MRDSEIARFKKNLDKDDACFLSYLKKAYEEIFKDKEKFVLNYKLDTIKYILGRRFEEDKLNLDALKDNFDENGSVLREKKFFLAIDINRIVETFEKRLSI